MPREPRTAFVTAVLTRWDWGILNLSIMPSGQHDAGSDWRYDDVWYRRANERSAGDFPDGARTGKPRIEHRWHLKEPPASSHLTSRIDGQETV
jgi:hypothetical protein